MQFNSFRCISCLWFISNHFICINTQQFFSSKPNQKQLYLTNNAGTNCSDIYFVVVVVVVIIIIRQVYFSLLYCTIFVLNEYYSYIFIHSWCVSVKNNNNWSNLLFATVNCGFICATEIIAIKLSDLYYRFLNCLMEWKCAVCRLSLERMPKSTSCQLLIVHWLWWVTRKKMIVVILPILLWLACRFLIAISFYSLQILRLYKIFI